MARSSVGRSSGVVVSGPCRHLASLEITLTLKSLLRSWRVLLLALAVLSAPQLSLVHALSHLAFHAGKSADERQQAPDKVCDTCLAFTQVGSALPTYFDWRAPADPLRQPEAAALHTIAPRPIAAFLARGPPPILI